MLPKGHGVKIIPTVAYPIDIILLSTELKLSVIRYSPNTRTGFEAIITDERTRYLDH